MQINGSRQNLLVAQAQIGKTLERKIAEFAPIPQHSFGRFIKVLAREYYLDEKDNDPVKITAFREDNLMNYLEEEEAASYEEYLENPPKTSIFNSLKDDDDDEYI